MMEKFFVFDVESIGLHGEGWSVGYVVVDRDGDELESGQYSCQPALAQGLGQDRNWVASNCPTPSLGYNKTDPYFVREAFADAWERWEDQSVLAADVCWPVESRFLHDIQRERYAFKSPYPLLDVASVLLGAGMDPMATYHRQPSEMPIHDSLADARQSARLLIEALNKGK